MSTTSVNTNEYVVPNAIASSVAGFEAVAQASIGRLRHKVRHKFSDRATKSGGGHKNWVRKLLAMFISRQW